MQLRKFRWSRVYESSEEELVSHLNSHKVTANHHVASEFEVITVPAQRGTSTLWCAEGSLSIAAESTLPMQPGDGVQIPADTPYTITAGIAGCIYYVGR